MQGRALAAMMIGQPTRIAAGQHGRQELDADHQSDDQIAEAQLVVDEQRDHRQRQADAKVAAEQRRNDSGRGTRQMSWRGLRAAHTLYGNCCHDSLHSIPLRGIVETPVQRGAPSGQAATCAGAEVLNRSGR